MQFKSCGRISERHKTPFNSWRCVALLVAYADAAREPSRSNKVTRVRRICINATARGRSRGHQRSMPRKVVSVKRDRQPFVHKKVDSPKKRATPRNKITRNISVFIGRFFFFFPSGRSRRKDLPGQLANQPINLSNVSTGNWLDEMQHGGNTCAHTRLIAGSLPSRCSTQDMRLHSRGGPERPTAARRNRSADGPRATDATRDGGPAYCAKRGQ